jgi:hypothetical protein
LKPFYDRDNKISARRDTPSTVNDGCQSIPTTDNNIVEATSSGENIKTNDAHISSDEAISDAQQVNTNSSLNESRLSAHDPVNQDDETNKSTDDISTEGWYTIKRILKTRVRERQRQFLVEWDDGSEPTWVANKDVTPLARSAFYAENQLKRRSRSRVNRRP